MHTVFYFHVPRTAGTSLRMYVERVLGKENILTIYGKQIPLAQDIIAGVRDWSRWKMVRGHVTTACLKSVPQEVFLMTILRNPVDRVASLYKYICRDPKHPIHHQVSRMTLDQFVTSRISLEANNGMIRQLCRSEPELPQEKYDPDIHPHTPWGKIETIHLAATMDVLSQFQLVGIVEDLDRTMSYLWRETGWKRERLPHANKTKVMEFGPSALEVVRKYNKLDQVLWEWARERLRGEHPWT